MRLLTLFPLLAYLVSAAPNAATPPERFQKAHDAILGGGDRLASPAAPGDKSAGRIDQFRDLWKERGQRNAKAAPKPPPPSKMEKLVGNAGERQRNKKGSPAGQNKKELSPALPAQNKKGSPAGQNKKELSPALPAQNKKGPASSPPQNRKGSPAPQKPKPKKKAAAGLERREIGRSAVGPALQCRGLAPQVPLEGNAKYANPEAFFRFAEQTLGTRYTPQQLVAAKRQLEDSLGSASERQKKQAGGGGINSADDEFLCFAGLTVEQVALPPPRAADIIQAEARNAGLDRFALHRREAHRERPHHADRHHHADRPHHADRTAYDDDDYYDWVEPVHVDAAHPGRAHGGPDRPTGSSYDSLYGSQGCADEPSGRHVHGLAPPPPPPPPPPSRHYRAGSCRDEREPDEPSQTDIDINTDESKTLLMMVEDIIRYIILYNTNSAEGVVVSTDGDVNLDLGLVDAYGGRPSSFGVEHDCSNCLDPYTPRQGRRHGQWPGKAVAAPTGEGGLSAAELDDLVRRLGSVHSAAAAVGTAEDGDGDCYDCPFFHNSGGDGDYDHYVAWHGGAKAKAVVATPVPTTPEGAKPGPESQESSPEGDKPDSDGAKADPKGQERGPEGDKPSSESAKPGPEGQVSGPEDDKPSSEGAKPGPGGQMSGLEDDKPGSEGAKPGPGGKESGLEDEKPGSEGAKPGPGGEESGPEDDKQGPRGAKPGLEDDKPGSEGATEQPPGLSDAQLHREDFDVRARELGQWCPISDEQVLRVLDAMA